MLVGEECDVEVFVVGPFPQHLLVMIAATFHQLPSILRVYLSWNSSEEMMRCHEVMASPVEISLMTVH